MSPERTQAYGRVMHTLNELGPSKLLADEQDRVRDAADTLIFAADLIEDPAAVEALGDVESLCAALVRERPLDRDHRRPPEQGPARVRSRPGARAPGRVAPRSGPLPQSESAPRLRRRRG